VPPADPAPAERAAVRRTAAIWRTAHTARPAHDTAVSHAALQRVGRGELGELLRLHETADLVAFGPVDRASPGFAAAVAAAHAQGFGSIVRLAGGRAAVFHRRTLAFAWIVPAAEPRADVRARFVTLADVVVEALGVLGVDARVGEVPGEWCPGEWSVNAAGRRKIMGVGQRLVRGAAHVGGVIVVGDAARARDVLVPVYDALGVPWDPATVGSIEDEVGPVSVAEVADAVQDAFARRLDLVPAVPDAATLAEADTLEAQHMA
jgi:octanoyl-[GcvH]:protein N-octanoyltransferase